MDFDQLGEARDAPIREATAARARARALVHIARAARQTLDDIPQYVDATLPPWAKIMALPILVPAGQSIGIFKRSYDTLSNLPAAFMGVMEGRVGIADIARGMWQTVKTDVAAVPEVAQLMLGGHIMTAQSRVGEVAFDVVPLMTGAGGALKSVPQSVARMTTKGMTAGAMAARGVFATFDDMAEAVAQTLRLEPEFALAGGPARLPSHTLAMAGHTPIKTPTWRTQPIGIAEAPARRWQPPRKLAETPKPLPHSMDRFKLVEIIRQQLGLDASTGAQIHHAMNSLPPSTHVQANGFGLIYSGKVPEGIRSLGTITGKGQRYAVCYDPKSTQIYLITR